MIFAVVCVSYCLNFTSGSDDHVIIMHAIIIIQSTFAVCFLCAGGLEEVTSHSWWP